MSDEIPLGKKEDLHLEFKSADALKDPEKIAREVVAMLNAEGGEVWIGLGEEEGRAVKVEAIPEPEADRQSLRDFLADSIEPAPAPAEIRLELVPVQSGSILRITVTAPGNGPYALLRKSGRFFWRRFDDRILPMSREEIREAFGGIKRSDDEKTRAALALEDELKELQRDAGGDQRGVFWLRIVPVPKFSLNLDALQDSDLLLDPRATENRRAGQTFFLAYEGGRPHRQANRLVMGEPSSAALTIYRDAGIQLRLPLQKFHAGHEPGAERPLYWLPLLEVPISVFRLLSKALSGQAFWEEPPAESTLLVSSVALLGLQGWTLRPHSPQLQQSQEWWNYLLQEPHSSSEPDFILAQPMDFTLAEVRDQPDRCGFRMVSRIYETFGFRTSEMPAEFDRKAGRLVLLE
jgi:hypothetical protein